MRDFIKIFLLLMVFLSHSPFHARTICGGIKGCADVLMINEVPDSSVVTSAVLDSFVKAANDYSLTAGKKAAVTFLYRPMMLHRDSVRHSLRSAYNQNAFRMRYDPFKEKMKEPWLGDILREIFFR